MYNNKIEWILPLKEIDNVKIFIVENALKIKFPGDYIKCVTKNQGGHPSLDLFYVTGRGEEVFDKLLSFDPDDSLYILDTYNAIRDRLVDDVYPFADDPFGNAICFDYRMGKDKPPKIVFWDHEIAFIDPEKSIFPICNNFTEFLEKLYTDLS